MDRVFTIVLGAASLVMAAATALLAVAIPAMWTMAGDIGTLKGQAPETARRFDALDKRMDSFDTKLDAVLKRVEGIDTRMAQNETDPARLLAQAGLRPASEFTGLRIGERLFVRPKSEQAQKDLASMGLQRETITPTTFGYLLGRLDPASGKIVIEATGAAPR